MVSSWLLLQCQQPQCTRYWAICIFLKKLFIYNRRTKMPDEMSVHLGTLYIPPPTLLSDPFTHRPGQARDSIGHYYQSSSTTQLHYPSNANRRILSAGSPGPCHTGHSSGRDAESTEQYPNDRTHCYWFFQRSSWFYSTLIKRCKTT